MSRSRVNRPEASPPSVPGSKCVATEPKRCPQMSQRWTLTVPSRHGYVLTVSYSSEPHFRHQTPPGSLAAVKLTT